jgi:hypothetical protein
MSWVWAFYFLEWVLIFLIPFVPPKTSIYPKELANSVINILASEYKFDTSNASLDYLRIRVTAASQTEFDFQRRIQCQTNELNICTTIDSSESIF